MSAIMLANEVENIRLKLPKVDEGSIERWLTTRTNWMKDAIRFEVDNWAEKKRCPTDDEIRETVRKWIASFRGEK